MVDKTKTETKEVKKKVQSGCVIQMKYIDNKGKECIESKNVPESPSTFVLGGRTVRVN